VALLLEAGLLLILIPWSTFWDRNYFAEAVPLLRDTLTNNYVRGAVSGLGLVNVLAALGELADLFLARRRNDALPDDHSRIHDGGHAG
jgi:hypothetical protein